MIKDISQRLSRARSVVFADFQGMTMKQLSDLRSKLFDLEAQFSVTKNTLLELALKENNYTVPDNIKTGTTATLFSFGDEISPIKTLVQTLKEAQVGKVKAGFLGHDLLDSAAVLKLATLPAKGELQGKVVGTLAAPLYGMVNVLQGNLRNLVYALDQIKQKKGGE